VPRPAMIVRRYLTSVESSGIVSILQSLGCSKIRVRDGTVDANCPFSKWRHERGVDKHPSFSVKAVSSGPSYYHCFTCGSKGMLSGMLRDLGKLGVVISNDFLESVRKEEGKDFEKANKLYPDMFGQDIERKIVRTSNEVWDEEELKPFVGKVPKYILNRGVSIGTCKTWELGYDEENCRVVFPVRRLDGKLVGAMSRALRQVSGAKYLPLFPFSKSLFLYGEHRAKAAERPTVLEAMGFDLPAQKGVILVEGMMDVLRMFEYGYEENILGLMTSSLSAAQERKVRDFNRPVYLMLDWDLSGIRGRMRCRDRLKGDLPLFDVPGVVKCSNCGGRWQTVCSDEGIDSLACRACHSPWPANFDKKDPDQLSKDEILDCLLAAEFVI
jgi:hypothetical protein